MSTWSAVRSILPWLAGPLALGGFFLPWAHGSGLLTGATFTGFSLVRFTGDLQGLQLSWFEGGALWAARLVILGVPIAGAWQTLLAPRWRWHPAYALSGWYLVVFVLVAVVVGLVRSGVAVPPLGLGLEFVGAGVFLSGRMGGRSAAASRS